jgi:hypothetical protein
MDGRWRRALKSRRYKKAVDIIISCLTISNWSALRTSLCFESRESSFAGMLFALFLCPIVFVLEFDCTGTCTSNINKEGGLDPPPRKGIRKTYTFEKYRVVISHNDPVLIFS